MKLIERNLGLEVDLREGIVSVIVIEKIPLRLSIVEQLYLGQMGKEVEWVLVENEKNYDLSKKTEIILEPFSLELNNKKVKTKLYQDIKAISQDVYFTQGLEIHSAICTYLENLFEKIPYPIKYEEEWNLTELLKAYGVELVEESDNLCEKLFNYIKLVSSVCNIDIFIIVNIKQYLSDDELYELYKLARYSKIQLLLIEFNMADKKSDFEDIYIIDKDGCIITY